MCGIALLLESPNNSRKELPSNDFADIWENLCSTCAARGPDWSESVRFGLAGAELENNIAVSVYASVLHLRGPDSLEALTRQPHVSTDGSIFVWNGEILEGLSIPNNENDGTKLFGLIQDSQGDAAALVNILAEIEGPYAFVYLNRPSKTLYFARDPLGRRSLLIHPPTLSEPFLALSSVASRYRGIEYDEVSTTGIFSLSLDNDAAFECMSSMQCMHRGTSVFAGQMTLNRKIPSNSPSLISLEQIDVFIDKLDESVKARVSNIPGNVGHTQSTNPAARLGILFSGGIDCSVLAYLADKHVPRGEPIDLLNVAFENPRSLNAPNKQSLQEGRAQRKRSKNERKEGIPVASIGDKHPIVANEPPKIGPYDVPDRITGQEEVEELRRLCPHRQWNFICVNVPYEECKREEPKVLSLMYPSRTVMDLSLALALYFASRGKGILNNSTSSSDADTEYTSSSKVLLSGLGSDELLGGYSRHKHAYSRGSWDALINELQLDLDRLPTRNLGRDDRVISAHGRESRYPFLSLSLVAYLAQLPVQVKVDPRLAIQEETLGAGMGDKTLLRLAADRLGLVIASKRVKRAMQFGSRSARMEGGSAEKKGHILLN
ncbi:adenine nucleotide alpha hydrolases-like protein [Ceratobasidium sp. AG-I]|nr:adenine nucleotide alpha hydrolases-like protein [Ceratobasidium sp. AG-I]